MATAKKKRLGSLPPSHKFILNPYPWYRASRCPDCEQLTRLRKFPLLIHVDPQHLIALNTTCRYCPYCDLILGPKLEIEHELTELFRQRDPQAIGNPYLIIGTVDQKAWREGLKQPKAVAEMLAHASDFSKYLAELRMTRGGWYHKDLEPPAAEPPPSPEWIKK